MRYYVLQPFDTAGTHYIDVLRRVAKICPSSRQKAPYRRFDKSKLPTLHIRFGTIPTDNYLFTKEVNFSGTTPMIWFVSQIACSVSPLRLRTTESWINMLE